MNKMFITMLIGYYLINIQVFSQIVENNNLWIEYLEKLDELAGDEEEQLLNDTYNELSRIVSNPMEINKVTTTGLQRLPFLSDQQIDELVSYRLRYGNMVSLYELKNLQTFDPHTISLFLPFVYIDENFVEKRRITVDNLLKYGSNEFIISYNSCFQQKSGYRSYPDSVLERYPNRKYLGEPFYQSMRYSYSMDDRIGWGMVAEKDAGEPLFNTYHKGYDYYSGYLELKDMNRLKTLITGDYKASFGQGLVISHDFNIGKGNLLIQPDKKRNGFRHHFSTNETDFLRGGATTIKVAKTDVNLFFSYKKLDGNVSGDKEINSFKTDGLHRTQGELDKKKCIPFTVWGGNINYRTNYAGIGITFLSYSFNNFTVNPVDKPYNVYYFRGRKNQNYSVDYLLKNNYMKFFGETALSRNGAVATLNGIQLSPTSYLSTVLLYRYYDKRYHSFLSKSFSQNTSIQNEQGLYIGIQWNLFKYVKLSSYMDHYRFPWLKYGTDSPSTGVEYMVQVDYNPTSKFSSYIRYRYNEREKNRTDTVLVKIDPYNTYRFRIQSNYHLSPVIFRTSFDMNVYHDKIKQVNGWVISQHISYQPVKPVFTADVFFSLFNTEDYSVRVTSYEKNLLYTFSRPSLYGKGIRYGCVLGSKLNRKLSLSLKVASTIYSDRERIGTDQEEIEGNRKTDLYLLIRWKI